MEDLSELGLAKPPYETFDSIVEENKVITCEGNREESLRAGKGFFVRLRYTKDSCFLLMQDANKSFKWLFALDALKTCPEEELSRYREGEIKVLANYLQLLVVLLSTKNIIKEVKECKTLKLGIGSKNRNRYTTTLKIGLITEHTGEKGETTGLLLRPHLRRGHIRRQHYGPGNEFIKKVFIEPVFVNADSEWIGERTAYNVSMTKGREP